jgi:predicted nucleic acid-binding protein
MILLDTSGLLNLHHADAVGHEEARTPFEAAGPKLVHSYVLAEFVALADVRRLPRASALAFAENLIEQPDVEVVWVGEGLHREAMSFLLSWADKRYSLGDAVRFLLMQRRGITEALTTDHHFEQAGFVRLLHPAR